MLKKIVFVCFIFLTTVIFADEIVIVADPWMPYTGDGDTSNGMLIDIATEIFSEAGHKVKYVIVPWSRAIQSTRDGDFNAIAGSFISDAPDFVFPSNEQGISSVRFYAKNDSEWTFTDITSLESVCLGVIMDYSYGDELDKYIEENKDNVDRIHIATGDDALTSLIKMLNAGRIGLFVEDQSVADYSISKSEDLVNISAKSTIGDQEKIWIAFSPAIPESKIYADILTKGMNKIREDGRLKKILDKYGLKDWE